MMSSSATIRPMAISTDKGGKEGNGRLRQWAELAVARRHVVQVGSLYGDQQPRLNLDSACSLSVR